MRIDLHLHTTKSDGVWTPERLFEEVRVRELDLFSVTDHDCMDAYPVPNDLRDRCIPGLEIDSVHDGHTVHVLAYGVNGNASPLLQALIAQRADRRRRMQSMVDSLNARGLRIHLDDVIAQTNGNVSLGRPHLARALVAKGHIGSVQAAFDRYLADEGECFVPLERLSSAAIIELTHASGGVAVIAHPMRLSKPRYLRELVECGVDGIEVVHPTADAEQQATLREFARQHDLLMTAGTDFHAPSSDSALGVEFFADRLVALAGRV